MDFLIQFEDTKGMPNRPTGPYSLHCNIKRSSLFVLLLFYNLFPSFGNTTQGLNVLASSNGIEA
jgi:hypothetical protein